MAAYTHIQTHTLKQYTLLPVESACEIVVVAC